MRSFSPSVSAGFTRRFAVRKRISDPSNQLLHGWAWGRERWRSCWCQHSLSVKKTWAARYLGFCGSLKSSMRPSTDWENAEAAFTFQTQQQQRQTRLRSRLFLYLPPTSCVFFYLIWRCDQVDGLHAGQRLTPLRYVLHNWGAEVHGTGFKKPNHQNAFHLKKVNSLDPRKHFLFRQVHVCTAKNTSMFFLTKETLTRSWNVDKETNIRVKTLLFVCIFWAAVNCCCPKWTNKRKEKAQIF